MFLNNISVFSIYEIFCFKHYWLTSFPQDEDLLTFQWEMGIQVPCLLSGQLYTGSLIIPGLPIRVNLSFGLITILCGYYYNHLNTVTTKPYFNICIFFPSCTTSGHQVCAQMFLSRIYLPAQKPLPENWRFFLQHQNCDSAWRVIWKKKQKTCSSQFPMPYMLTHLNHWTWNIGCTLLETHWISCLNAAFFSGELVSMEAWSCCDGHCVINCL